jgi:SpoVK/Ycf46/Vps4 family AAA+-type ATPase
MARDHIVEDLHKVREALAERFGNDIQAICADAQRRQDSEGHRVVSLAPRPVVVSSRESAAQQTVAASR